MDLSSIRSKIGSNNQNSYQSVNCFERDVKLMVENCRIFNGTTSANAHRADEVWATWLQVKPCLPYLNSKSRPRNKTGHSGRYPNADVLKDSSLLTDATRLASSLLLIEPFTAAFAAAEIIDELEKCSRLRLLPNQCPRIARLHHVLAIQLTSRRAMGLELQDSQIMTEGVHNDAPALLEYLWISKKGLPNSDRDNETNRAKAPAWSRLPSWTGFWFCLRDTKREELMCNFEERAHVQFRGRILAEKRI